MDFRWVSTSYVYTIEKWTRNFIHEFLNAYRTYVLTAVAMILMHVNKHCYEFDQ